MSAADCEEFDGHLQGFVGFLADKDTAAIAFSRLANGEERDRLQAQGSTWAEGAHPRPYHEKMPVAALTPERNPEH